MALDPLLLEILRCPAEHRAPLTYDAEAGTLTCTECARVFPIRDDIPVLLLDEAVTAAAGNQAAVGNEVAAGDGAPAGEEAP